MGRSAAVAVSAVAGAVLVMVFVHTWSAASNHRAAPVVMHDGEPRQNLLPSPIPARLTRTGTTRDASSPEPQLSPPPPPPSPLPKEKSTDAMPGNTSEADYRSRLSGTTGGGGGKGSSEPVQLSTMTSPRVVSELERDAVSNCTYEVFWSVGVLEKRAPFDLCWVPRASSCQSDDVFRIVVDGPSIFHVPVAVLRRSSGVSTMRTDAESTATGRRYVSTNLPEETLSRGVLHRTSLVADAATRGDPDFLFCSWMSYDQSGSYSAKLFLQHPHGTWKRSAPLQSGTDHNSSTWDPMSDGFHASMIAREIKIDVSSEMAVPLPSQEDWEDLPECDLVTVSTGRWVSVESDLFRSLGSEPWLLSTYPPPADHKRLWKPSKDEGKDRNYVWLPYRCRQVGYRCNHLPDSSSSSNSVVLLVWVRWLPRPHSDGLPLKN
jgi:hypothetical protein